MIKILITGDFCLNGRNERLAFSKKYDDIYNDFLPHLKDNDINITNLECPFINKANPISKIGPNLRSAEECFSVLAYGNFNLVTLSNNHILDHGENGILSTIQLCRNNNIEYIGAGRNLEEASQILFKEVANKRIAFLNFSENEFSTAGKDHPGSNPINPVRNYYDIKTARENSDYVIVIVHGGHEDYFLPSTRMIDTYRFYIDAGADIVIGHHTHCFSGYESYNSGYIFYSLGNFIFDWEGIRNSNWNYGKALKLFLDGEKITFETIPFKQSDSKPGLFLLNKTENLKFRERIEEINKIISDEKLLESEWKRFVQKRKKSYLLNFEVFNSGIYRSLRYRNLLPGFISKKKKLMLLNLIRCESHRDVLIDSLKV